MNSNIDDIFRNKIVEKLDKILRNKTNSRIIEKSIYTGVLSALKWMEPGDLLLLLALDQKEECIEAIQNFCEA